MSILIPGMEMPKSCSTEACFVRTVSYEDGTVWCPVAKGYIGDQATVCPLIPVPEHGDLIERDKLIENCMQEDSFIAELLFRKVNNAPTIIPAEEVENGT